MSERQWIKYGLLWILFTAVVCGGMMAEKYFDAKKEAQCFELTKNEKCFKELSK